MTDRPNYYVLLDLDPSVVDPAAISARIQDKQREWAKTKTMGAPKVRRKAETYLEMLPDITATMGDDALRDDEADAARQELADVQAAKRAELDDKIDILIARGGPVREDDLQNLVKLLGNVVPRAEVERRVREKGLEIARARPKQRPDKLRLDGTIAKKIRTSLGITGDEDLYAFLGTGFSKNSESSLLGKQARKMYQDIIALGALDGVEKARKELAGLAEKAFESEEAAQRYENTRSWEVLKGLEEHITLSVTGNVLTADRLDKLVRTARERFKVKPDDALAFIEEFAAKGKIIVAEATGLPAVDLLQCGYCDTLATQADQERCLECHELLVQPCRRCQTPTPTQYSTCQGCGSHIGDAPNVKKLVAEADRLRAAGEYVESIRHFDQALHIWSDHAPAIQGRKQVESLQRQREGELRRIETLVSGRELMKAQRELERVIRSIGSGGTDGLRRRIDEGLTQANKAYKEGERHRRAGAGDLAFDCYERALRHCQDHGPAKEAMVSDPPPEAVKLDGRVTGNGVRLTWRATPARGRVTYRVVRKRGGAPAGDADGEVLAEEVGATRYDDTQPEAGTPWYYAVFSRRGGVSSTRPATTGPHLVLAGVTGLDLEAANRQVTLRWTPPAGCVRVEVWRAVGREPRIHGEGRRIQVTNHSAVDGGLTNGTTYGYRILPVFMGASGKELFGPASKRTVTPVAPPAQVEDLAARRQERTVLLTWTPLPDPVQVQIRGTDDIPTYTPGQIVSTAAAGQFGEAVPLTGTGSTQVELSGQGRMYFVPLSVLAQTAVVGPAVAVTTLDDVVDLQTRLLPDRIVLTWAWPAGTTEALVRYSHETYPTSPVDGPGAADRITASLYKSQGGWVLEKPARRRYFFTVFVKDPRAELYSSGVQAFASMGQEVKVAYQVRMRRALLGRAVKQAWIELECAEPCTLTGLEVRGDPVVPPAASTDGVRIAGVDRLEIDDGRARIDIPRAKLGRRMYLKLFFKDPRACAEIHLRPRAMDKLLLG